MIYNVTVRVVQFFAICPEDLEYGKRVLEERIIVWRPVRTGPCVQQWVFIYISHDVTEPRRAPQQVLALTCNAALAAAASPFLQGNLRR